jgi:hypothetical protein
MDEPACDRPLTRRQAPTEGIAAGASILVGCSFVFGDDPREDPVLTRFPRGRSEVVGSVYGDIDSAMLLS